MYVSKLLLTLLFVKFEAIDFSLDGLNCKTYVNIYAIICSPQILNFTNLIISGRCGLENLNKYV